MLPDQFSTFFGLETAASHIRHFRDSLIPGLLQTTDYSKEVLLAGPIAPTKAAIDRTMSARAERREILERDDPPELRVVLDEAVLRREIGGPNVMREQVEHLIDVGQRPNVKIHVLPNSAGAHPALDGSFVLLDFPPPPDGYPTTSDPRVVYIESLSGALYLEKPAELAAYGAAWDGLCATAHNHRESQRVLRIIADEYGRAA